jgi:hypothetical protein
VPTRQTDLLVAVENHIKSYLTANNVTPSPPVRISFDPHRKMEDDIFRIFVIPDVYEVNIGESIKRTKVLSVMSTIYISVSFSKKFTGVDDYDIAPWAEIKPLMDLREDICLHLIRQPYVGAELRDAEINIIDDPEKNNRQFLSFLTMGFQTSACN